MSKENFAGERHWQEQPLGRLLHQQGRICRLQQREAHLRPDRQLQVHQGGLRLANANRDPGQGELQRHQLGPGGRLQEGGGRQGVQHHLAKRHLCDTPGQVWIVVQNW